MLSLIRSRLPLALTAQTVSHTWAYCYHGLIRDRRDSRLERNFHSVSGFREQVKFFQRQGVLALAEAIRPRLDSESSSKRAAVITFDDGYANNLLAAEILADAKMPWTLFVSTGATGRHGIIWTVELSLLLLHGHIAQLNALDRTWPLASRGQREAAFQAIRIPLKSMPANLRRTTMDIIRAQFPSAETERVLGEFPSFQMLTWKEIRDLADAGVEIGSHGVDHELHHAAQNPGVRRQELVESKREIERQIGRPCRFFAFPNGDYCEHSAKELEDAGYQAAFTTEPGCIKGQANWFNLPRVTPSGSLAKLKQQLKAPN